MHRFARIAILIPLAAPLSACAGASWLPSFLQRDPHYTQATLVPDPPPIVRTVNLVEPLPLPGQLESKPVAEKHSVRPPRARVLAANRAALEEPSSDNYVNAIQVYPYSKGALYRLYAAPQEVSDIALQPGENLIAISAGDTTRWVVGNTTSGAGKDRQVHILAKPFSANLHTNLVITTDRRCYHLALESTPRTYMAAISWTYPDDSLVSANQDAGTVGASVADPVPSLDDLHFDYAISGDDPQWRPLRAFDDGNHVYIEFPEGIAEGDAPPLFIAGNDGKSELVNYRMRGRYYVVDRLFVSAELRLGQDHQQVVRITRTANTRTADAGTDSKTQ